MYRFQINDSLNPFTPSGLFYLKSLDKSISYIRGVWLFLSSPCFIEIPVFNANNVDPDQTPRYAASDLYTAYVPFTRR